MSKPSYAMENPAEALRLEKQALLPAYRIQDELREFTAQPGERILDAGCGSGLLSRYLVDHFPRITMEACDFSMDRLNTARSLAQTAVHKEIRFFESSVQNIQVDDQFYDQIICRFTLEHNRSPEQILNEFFRILKPGGKLWVIDLDGIVLNLYPVSPELKHYLDLLERGYPGDLRIGRKLPSLFLQTGFQDVHWKVEANSFQGDALEAELIQTEERFTFARPILTRILGSELEAHKFKRLYCHEMMVPGATLFYDKFIVTGTR